MLHFFFYHCTNVSFYLHQNCLIIAFFHITFNITDHKLFGIYMFICMKNKELWLFILVESTKIEIFQYYGEEAYLV